MKNPPDEQAEKFGKFICIASVVSVVVYLVIIVLLNYYLV